MAAPSGKAKSLALRAARVVNSRELRDQVTDVEAGMWSLELK